MHAEHNPDPLVQADQLLTETWEALREYRKDLAPEHAELVDALLGAVAVVGFPLKYLLDEV